MPLASKGGHRDAEVGDQGASAGQEDVRWLHVAVDDSGRVESRQPAGDIGQDRHQDLGRQPSRFRCREAFRQGAVLAQIHDQEGHVADRWRCRLDVVDGNDIRVAERRQGAGLAIESSHDVGVGRLLRQQDLDGHIPFQAKVTSPEDGREAAGSDACVDPIAAHEGVAQPDHRGRVPEGTEDGSQPIVSDDPRPIQPSSHDPGRPKASIRRR